MRICLRSLSGNDWHGGAMYIQNMAAAIGSLPAAHRADVDLTVEVRRPTPETVAALEASGATVIVPGRVAAALRGWSKSRESLRLPARLTNPHGFDFIYPELAGPHVPYAWASWIPDFQYLYLPELFPESERLRRTREADRMARLAPKVVLSSQMARDDFVRTYPEAAERAGIIHFASAMDDSAFGRNPEEVRVKYGLPERFFLVSNQLWVHKNHQLVADAVAILAARRETPTVVCTGGMRDDRHPTYADSFRERLDELGIVDHFLMLGFIPRSDQVQLMRRCVAVIQPSRFEGWSTVVEDAKALGRPILLSDFPVHHEQAPSDGRFFPMDDADALATLMEEASADAPGPDAGTEARARQETRARVQAFGSALLDLAGGR